MVVASVKINANMRLVSRDGDCIDLVAYLVMMKYGWRQGGVSSKAKNNINSKLRSETLKGVVVNRMANCKPSLLYSVTLTFVVV